MKNAFRPVSISQAPMDELSAQVTTCPSEIDQRMMIVDRKVSMKMFLLVAVWNCKQRN